MLSLFFFLFLVENILPHTHWQKSEIKGTSHNNCLERFYDEYVSVEIKGWWRESDDVMHCQSCGTFPHYVCGDRTRRQSFCFVENSLSVEKERRDAQLAKAFVSNRWRRREICRETFSILLSISWLVWDKGNSIKWDRLLFRLPPPIKSELLLFCFPFHIYAFKFRRRCERTRLAFNHSAGRLFLFIL